jgi:hypothetical protein
VKALSFDEYERLSAAGGPVPVFREIPGDLLTPVSAFLALEARASRAFLLESVIGGERIARYSFLSRSPAFTLEARANGVIRRDASGETRLAHGLLPALRAALGPPAPAVPGLPRFTGGLVGYLSYDAVRLFEKIPDRHGASRAAARVVLVLPLAGRVRSRAAADRADRERGARRAPRLRGRAVRAGRARGRSAAPGIGRAAARGAAPQRQRPGRRRVLPRRGRAGQGVHRGGRHLPGRALAPARAGVPRRSIQRVPRAAHGEPFALHVLPEGRGPRHRRRVAGDAGARRGSVGGDAPARGHAPARGERRGGRAHRAASCCRIRRSAPST